MKKHILLLLTFVVFSCNKDYTKLNIEDFTKKQAITLKPYKYKPYVKCRSFFCYIVKVTYKVAFKEATKFLPAAAIPELYVL